MWPINSLSLLKVARICAPISFYTISSCNPPPNIQYNIVGVIHSLVFCPFIKLLVLSIPTDFTYNHHSPCLFRYSSVYVLLFQNVRSNYQPLERVESSGRDSIPTNQDGSNIWTLAAKVYSCTFLTLISAEIILRQISVIVSVCII